MSYLTQSEIDALQDSDLPRDTPYLICGVSQTQFSIARYYGGCTFNGASYTYLPDTDELIRDDVRKFVLALRRRKKAKPDTRFAKTLFNEEPEE